LDTAELETKARLSSREVLFVNAALTQEVEKEADLNRLSSAISRVVKLKEF
jgi:hypothetical protein